MKHSIPSEVGFAHLETYHSSLNFLLNSDVNACELMAAVLETIESASSDSQVHFGEIKSQVFCQFILFVQDSEFCTKDPVWCYTKKEHGKRKSNKEGLFV